MFQKNITDNMLFLGIEKMYTHSTTKDLSDNIKKQVDEYWTRRHTRIKFVQLQLWLYRTDLRNSQEFRHNPSQRILEARCASKRLVCGIFLNRLFTLIVCVICGSLIFDLYIKERVSLDGRELRHEFNCKLPPSYHYWDTNGNVRLSVQFEFSEL